MSTDNSYRHGLIFAFSAYIMWGGGPTLFQIHKGNSGGRNFIASSDLVFFIDIIDCFYYVEPRTNKTDH